MTVFEYVSVLLAIILGLAVARVMGGLAGFIIAERRVTRDWIVAGWCVALAYMQTVWWLLKRSDCLDTALHERLSVGHAFRRGG